MFIAGNCMWNPCAPRFPGDNGMVDANFVDGHRGVQDEYHMFTSCSTRQGDPHYHGKEAKCNDLYLGNYSTPEKGSDDDITEGLPFKALEPRLQWFRAEHFHRKRFMVEWIDPEAKNPENPHKHEIRRACESSITQAHKDQAKQKYINELNDIAEAKWEDMAHVKRAKVAGSIDKYKAAEVDKAMKEWPKKEMIAAWVVMLCGMCYVIDIIPVKFESYDDALYEELISIGATNGHVTLGAASV
jgi:hypothetical protein